MRSNCHQTVTGPIKKGSGITLSPCFYWSERLDSNQRPLSPQDIDNSQVLENARAFGRNKQSFSGFVPVQTVTNCHRAANVLLAAGLFVSSLFLSLPTAVIVATAANATASWYGPGFHNRRTASGERFNQWAMTAAHRTLAFGTLVRVAHAGRSVIVRINDRGPFTRGRQIDLSRGAAQRLHCLGVCRVSIAVVGRRAAR